MSIFRYFWCISNICGLDDFVARSENREYKELLEYKGRIFYRVNVQAPPDALCKYLLQFYKKNPFALQIYEPQTRATNIFGAIPTQFLAHLKLVRLKLCVKIQTKIQTKVVKFRPNRFKFHIQ